MGSKAQDARSGRWPTPLRRFYWDLLPGKLVPPNDGLQAPEYVKPAWLSATTSTEFIEHAIRAHDQADARATEAQEKGARLLNLSLTLLGAAFALAGWQVQSLQKLCGLWCYLVLSPVGLSILCLAIAALEALEIDRVGMFYHPGVEVLASGISRLEIEDQGREVANWTASRKLTVFLEARAWFSRGLLVLFLSALLSILLLFFG